MLRDRRRSSCLLDVFLTHKLIFTTTETTPVDDLPCSTQQTHGQVSIARKCLPNHGNSAATTHDCFCLMEGFQLLPYTGHVGCLPVHTSLRSHILWQYVEDFSPTLSIPYPRKDDRVLVGIFISLDSLCDVSFPEQRVSMHVSAWVRAFLS